MNIALLTMARSRSSVFAEIFREHGVFFGDTWRPEDRRVGYNEHKWAKDTIQASRPNIYDEILAGRAEFTEIEGFEAMWLERLKAEGWDGGAWGVKVDVFCSRLFPEAMAIGLWRDPGAIALSARAALGRNMPDWKGIIAAHHYALRMVSDHIINSDEVVIGEDASLRRAFELIEIKYDPKITEAVLAVPHSSPRMKIEGKVA